MSCDVSVEDDNIVLLGRAQVGLFILDRKDEKSGMICFSSVKICFDCIFLLKRERDNF